MPPPGWVAHARRLSGGFQPVNAVCLVTPIGNFHASTWVSITVCSSNNWRSIMLFRLDILRSKLTYLTNLHSQQTSTSGTWQVEISPASIYDPHLFPSSATRIFAGHASSWTMFRRWISSKAIRTSFSVLEFKLACERGDPWPLEMCAARFILWYIWKLRHGSIQGQFSWTPKEYISAKVTAVANRQMTCSFTPLDRISIHPEAWKLP